jgi:hypothetical protein
VLLEFVRVRVEGVVVIRKLVEKVLLVEIRNFIEKVSHVEIE